MKSPFQFKLTLRPVRRVASFFLGVGLFVFTSCGEPKGSAVSLVQNQAETISAMATALDEYRSDQDSERTVARLNELGENLKKLKIQLAGVERSRLEDQQGLSEVKELSLAMEALLKSQERLSREGRLSPEIAQALSSHLNPEPMPGEGIFE